MDVKLERIALAYLPEEEKIAKRIAAVLRNNGLRVELETHRDSEVYSQDDASRRLTLRLWTWHAAKRLETRSAELEAEPPSRALLLRLEDTPLPPGTTEARILDLIGWDGDPHAKQAQRLLQEIRSEYARNGRKAATERVAKLETTQLKQIELLLAAIDAPKTEPRRRLEIGDRLAELGDPRPGVGLRADGVPEIDWVEIPAGEFLYGENKEQQHLDIFWMARYPVTNAQYQAFIDDGGYREDRWWRGLAERIEAPAEPTWSQANRPRERVSWYEAMAFCAWLSERLGTTVRLPTEQQWEKAARSTDGREYPWGDNYISGYANIDETLEKAGEHYLQQTTAVGLYPKDRSPYGVMDLTGNVWEWCLNSYANPNDTSVGGKDRRVLRGGSWYYSQDHARASYRDYYSPDFRINDIGFRVCRLSPID